MNAGQHVNETDRLHSTVPDSDERDALMHGRGVINATYSPTHGHTFTTEVNRESSSHTSSPTLEPITEAMSHPGKPHGATKGTIPTPRAPRRSSTAKRRDSTVLSNEHEVNTPANSSEKGETHVMEMVLLGLAGAGLFMMEMAEEPSSQEEVPDVD